MATTTSTSRPGTAPGDQANSPSASPESRGGSLGRTLARIARLFALAALMAGLGYGAGRLHARLQARDTEAQLRAAEQARVRELEHAQAVQQEALTSARAAVERAGSERSRLLALARLYEGYRVTQQALSALDARNFGIAESGLRAAQQELAPLSSQIDGLAPLLAQMADTKIVVTDNLAPQHQAILALVTRLDELIVVHRAPLSDATTQ
ncbi:MAG TPA: hypothetical protein VG963_17155 [Polyangiaceae bacterium]|nr:hypothetical protein [Polyangiaceae bacterium]